MTLGAQPKKVVILGVLLAAAGVALYMNVFAGDSGSPAPVQSYRPPVLADPVNKAPAPATPRGDSRRGGRGSANASGEIKPRQGWERPEDRPDPATIDPTLRLDLLAKVQNVEPAASMRNIFQYGVAPPPPSAKIDLPKVGTIAVNRGPALPPPPPPPVGPPPVPPKPTAPPIPMKYYGYQISKADGTKKAFLLDGDDIIIAGENDTVKRGRYKVVAIGLTSITIEDTQFKSNQTVRIQEDPVV
jgi:hypothetical protein